MTSQDDKKRAAAEAALERVPEGVVVGVGTGSTANFFIDALARRGGSVRGAVASSQASAERLAGHGIPLMDLAEAGELPIYVDGADEVTAAGEMVKGGGGALTREKIVAFASRLFVCIVDDGKLVSRLGAFPLPIEVIPLAVPVVERELRELGGDPCLREGFETDNGNRILDLHDWGGGDPLQLEESLNHIPGVVTNGLFCRRGADSVMVAGDDGVRHIECGVAREI